MGVTRPTGVLVAAIVITLIGGVLTIALADANPAAVPLLTKAQQVTARASSVHYQAVITMQSPSDTPGQQLVAARRLDGVEAFGQGWDVRSSSGGLLVEYRSTTALAGVLVRGAEAPAPIDTVRWALFPNFRSFEAVVLAASSTSHAPSPEIARAGLAAAVLADDLSDAGTERALMASASVPRRASRNDPGTLIVTLAPSALSENLAGISAADITSVSGQIQVTTAGRLDAMAVSVVEGTVTVSARFRFDHWNAPVTVLTPAPSDIASPRP